MVLTSSSTGSCASASKHMSQQGRGMKEILFPAAAGRLMLEGHNSKPFCGCNRARDREGGVCQGRGKGRCLSEQVIDGVEEQVMG
jgi:hypothetical protein